MNIDVRGIHGYSMGESTKKYIDKKMHCLDRLQDHVIELQLCLDRDNSGEFKAKANIHYRWKTLDHISTNNRNLFKAIDDLFDKIKQKTAKEKEKVYAL